MSEDSYRIEWTASSAVIATPAEIDVTNSAQTRRALLAAVARHPAVLIIDMSETTFCDSTGVEAIVAAYRQAAAAGTQLRLVAPEIERILTLTGIGQVVPVHSTLAAAHAAAADGPR